LDGQWVVLTRGTDVRFPNGLWGLSLTNLLGQLVILLKPHEQLLEIPLPFPLQLFRRNAFTLQLFLRTAHVRLFPTYAAHWCYGLDIDCFGAIPPGVSIANRTLKSLSNHFQKSLI